MTAFDELVTFADEGGMFVATTYRFREQLNAFALPEIITPNHFPVKHVDINLFHRIYCRSHENLLVHTAGHLGVTAEGEMHVGTGCSMAKGYRKNIPHQTEHRAQTEPGRVSVYLGDRKETAFIGVRHYSINRSG